MLRNSINAISVGCQKNAGQESECVLFFFESGSFRVRVRVRVR